MSEYVELAPDGLFVYKWSPKKQKNIRRRAKKMLVCTHLRSECKVAEGTTFKDILNTVGKYKFLSLVIGQYAWCRHMDEFIKLVNEPMRPDPEEEENDGPLDYLEIYWHPEVHEFTEKVTHPGGHRERIRTVDFDVSTGFHGIGRPPKGKEEDPQYKTDDGTIPYSVSCTPMWKLADLPVKLNTEFTVYEPWVPGRHKRGNPPGKLIESERCFSLLEVLDSIFWDISFYGGPADNEKFIDQMKETVEEIKSGEVACIPLDQVLKRMGDNDEDKPEEVPDDGEKKIKVVMHPDVARMLGVDPDSIPLDDKEILRGDEQ